MALVNTGLNFQNKGFPTYSRQLKQADKLTGQWNKTLTKTAKSATKLEGTYTKQTKTLRKYQTTITRVQRNTKQYQTQIQGLDRTLANTSTRIKGSTTALNTLSTTQNRITQSATRMSTALTRTDSNLRTLISTAKSGSLRSLGTTFSSAGRGATTLRDNLTGTVTKIKEVGTAASNQVEKINSFTGTITKGIAGGFAAIALAGTAAGVGAVTTAASYEAAFVGVGKTVDGIVEIGVDGYVQLTEAGEAFRDSIEELTETTIPRSVEELAAIAEQGAQLGITEGLNPDETQKVLLEFTETIAGLAVSTNLTEEEAAQSLARISGIFGVESVAMGENINSLGNVIVELGNTTKTNEALITSFANRLAGAGNAAGLTQADIFGIAASFSSVGITAEAGGTAVSKALLDIQTLAAASESGIVDNNAAISDAQTELQNLSADLVRLEAQSGLSGQALVDSLQGLEGEELGRALGDRQRESLFNTQNQINELRAELEGLEATNGQAFNPAQLQAYLDVINSVERDTLLTADAFKELATDNPAELFTQIVEGLAASTGDTASTLEDLGFTTAQARQAFLSMAGDADSLRKNIEASNEQFDSGNALAEETEIFYATLEARFERFQNVIRNTAADIGDVFLPAIGDLLAGAGELVDIVGDRVPEVFTALVTKIGELEGVDLGVLDFDTILDTGFDNLITAINEFDVTPIQEGLEFLVDDIFPVFNTGVQFVSDNWETFKSVLIGLGTAAGIAVTISALSSVAAGVALVLSPIGLAVAAVTGLTVAWRSNFLGIQDITKTAVDTITGFVGELTGEGGLQGALSSIGVPEGLLDTITAPFEDVRITEAIDGLKESIGQLFEGESLTRLQEGATAIMTSLGLVAGALGIAFTTAIATTVDQITGLIGVFDGIIQVVDSFLEFDLEGIGSGLTTIGDGLATILLAPFENITEAITGEDLDLKTVITTALNDANQAILDFAWVEVLGPSILWAGETTIQDGLDAVNEFLAGFTWFDIPEITLPDPSVGDMSIIDVLVAINETITNFVWNELPALELPTLDTVALGTQLLGIITELPATLTGILTDVDLGLPTLPDIATKIAELKDSIVDGFTGIFTGIDLGFPEIPETIVNLAGTVGIDLTDDIQEAETQANELGAAIPQGAADGVEANEDTWLDSLGNTASAGVDLLKSAWEWESPSGITFQLGVDIDQGLADGLTANNAAIMAAEIIQMQLLTGFNELGFAIIDNANPSLDELTARMDNLGLITFPSVTATLVDGLIPAKHDLTAANTTLIPTVDTLTESESSLASMINGQVTPAIEQHTGAMKTSRDEMKRLDKALKNLIARYKALAAAITKAKRAGSGVSTGVTGNEPVGPGASLAAGGSLIVPNNIAPEVRGPTGGMLIEVHPKELVNVIPAPQVRNIPESAPVNAMPVSGASVATQTGNTTNQTTNNEELHLHVTESVDKGFRGNFDLMRTMSGRNR